MENRSKNRVAYTFGGPDNGPGSPFEHSPSKVSKVEVPGVEEIKDEEVPETEEPEVEESSDTNETETSEPSIRLSTTSSEDEDEEEEVDNVRSHALDDDYDDSSEDEDDINIYYNFALQAKDDGILPEDFKVTDDIDPYSFYNALKAHARESEAAQAKETVLEELKAQGVNEANIRRLYLLQQGYSEQQLSASFQFEQLANSPDDADDKTMKAVIQAYHQARNYSNSDSSRIINNLSDDELVDEYLQSKQYFSQAKKELQKQEKQAYEQQKQQVDQIRQRNKSIIDGIISHNRIGNTSIPKSQAKALNDAIHDKTEQIEVQGNVYDASKYQVFDYKLNNDLEFRLAVFNSYLHKDSDIEEIKQQVQEDVEKKYLKALPQRPIVRKNKKKAIKGGISPVDPDRIRRKVGSFSVK